MDKDLRGLPLRYREVSDCVKAMMQSLALTEVALWGTGETGQLLFAILTGIGVKVCEVYDSKASGHFHGIVIKRPPTSFNFTVLLAVAPDSPGFNEILAYLKRHESRVICFGSDVGADAYRSEIAGNGLPVVSGEGPLAHSLNNKALRQFRDTRLIKFRDRHDGETCIILGNGPSLLKMDFTQISQVPTFGLNKVFKLFGISTFRPTYLCSYIKDVVGQCATEFKQLDTLPIFLAHECLDIVPPVYDHIYYVGPHKQNLFSLDPMKEICCGFTVSYVAMQLAFYMGFRKVILVGMDHNYAGFEGKGDQWQRIEESRPMHFDPDYFSKGQFWQTPNFKMMESYFAFARHIFEHSGRRIVDATVDGNLKVFDKIPLQDALI
ncbi:MAG: DUF115 domain-containing protein [Hahellaceae bacterium]|nr:DUF115 domain-containing protein [Hahellaceae bacterium]